MKKSLRLLAMALSVLMLFCLTACGGGEDTSTPADSSDVSADVDAPMEDNTTDSSTPVEEDNNPDTATTTKGKVTTAKGKVTTTKKEETKKTPTTKKKDPNKWSQDEFFISTFKAFQQTYGLTQSQMEGMAAMHKSAGFTLIENAIMGNTEVVTAAKACEAAGIRFLTQGISGATQFSGMGEKVPPADAIENNVKRIVNELKDCEYLEGYYTWDEVTTKHFTECKNLNGLFNKNDPKRLAFSIVFPSYGAYRWTDTTEKGFKNSDYYKYVTEYVKTVDPQVLCFDYYPFSDKNSSLIGNDMWRDMGLFRNLSLETGKPFWFYFQAQANSAGYTFTNAHRSSQMYGAIAYGAKTVSYFMSLGVIIDKDGIKLEAYDDVKSLNAKVKNLGDYLFNKTNEELYQFGLNSKNKYMYQLDDVAKSDLIASGPEGVIISVFGDGTDTKYVLVVNLNHKSSKTGILTLKTNKKIRIYDHTQDKTFKISDKAKTIDLALAAGECALYIVE